MPISISIKLTADLSQGKATSLEDGKIQVATPGVFPPDVI